jgi:hypothetical protein
MTRAVDCPCGHRLEAESDEALIVLAREHMDRDHLEMQRTDEQIRQRIAAAAVDVVPR